MTKTRHTPLFLAFAVTAMLTALCMSSCARMGSPDGGWFDETPPHVVSASPEDKGTNVKSKKVVIAFDEIIKVENATEKVVVSPPQLEQPEIKATGKRITVELKDSLKENTTYTIDFSDAISDNNEGNPMGNYTYSFSTGKEIDTLEVSGIVLNAEDLEPIKGTLVGLYADLSDSAFTTKPLLRVSRTDSQGRFVIRGIAPGEYRVYALNDMDGDFKYSQASEALAFTSDIISPVCKQDVRQDTIWADSLHIRDIKPVEYTHFMPDNIVLRQFVKDMADRYFLKAERRDERHIDLFFSGKSDHEPVIKGLDFDHTDAFVKQKNETNDTISFWLKDTTLINRDTLNISLEYEATDTSGVRRIQTDNLTLVVKTPFVKRQQELKKRKDEWYKSLQKKLKNNPEAVLDTIYREKPYTPEYKLDQFMAPDGMIRIYFPVPLAQFDTTSIHLYVNKDEKWYVSPFVIKHAEQPYYAPETLEMYAEWIPGLEYSFEVDTLAFESIYGLKSHPYKTGFKIKPLNNFASLFVNVSGVEADSVVVQLLSQSDAVVKQALAVNHTAEFYYIKPENYYIRAFLDLNGNGKWDAGNYEEGLQPEPVYYNPDVVECKENWDLTRNWDLTHLPLERQKPAKITKQKADRKKTIGQRNAQRARDKGIIWTGN